MSEIKRHIRSVSLETPDPSRAERNLIRFFENVKDHEPFRDHLQEIALLFSVSQFLTNYSLMNPDELINALNNLHREITPDFLCEMAQRELKIDDTSKIEYTRVMKLLRTFRRRYLLRITLRFILSITDIIESMREVSDLAQTIIEAALHYSLEINTQRYGEPEDGRIALIAIGKLGGRELNYSSDVDLMAVYDCDDGMTSGILNPSGMRFSRITNHEFFCRVVELMSRLLSTHTEDGIGYRIDLRLRPQGQKGNIALPLKAYETYYESWGRTWERMVLIRARPVAGDKGLGQEFMKAIEPFLWRKSIDYTEIEEIRGMKKKIDSTVSRDDIKRGYGGIREAEFFVQAFQLLYGGDNPHMRCNNMLNAIDALRDTGLVPRDELSALKEGYLFLRKIEHYLQMSDDLQTHALPTEAREITALAKKMGFRSDKDFLSRLKLIRMRIKNMYNSILGTSEDVHAEALNLLEGDLSDDEIRGFLEFRGTRDTNRSMASLINIREHMNILRTSRERSMVRKVLPVMLELALRSESPDRALSGLESLLTSYRIRTVHMSALLEQKELLNGLIKMFALSPYLTRIFLSDQMYLNILIEEWGIVKSMSQIKERLERALKSGDDLESTLAMFRRIEEIRLGILYLQGILTIDDLFNGLTHVAEAILRAILKLHGHGEMCIIALGKLGGKEFTFGSDLDILFVSETGEAMKDAERITKILSSYTDSGQLYVVDTRLRPDGSKGILVKNIQGYRSYYMYKAMDWEVQTLLKARYVGGDREIAYRFMDMAKDVLMKRGGDIGLDKIHEMRRRIIKEISREGEGIDIKLGPGGIEDIEFYTQYLQLRNINLYPELMVQNTIRAIISLMREGVISTEDAGVLIKTYKYYRMLETFLRLNEADMITEGSELALMCSKFMGHKSPQEFIENLHKLRQRVLAISRY